MARPVYRALGVEPLRHRPNATKALLARRLLAFDYVLEHRDRPWLPTEDDKVTALTAVGVPAAVLPQRVYAGRQGRGLTRYFVNMLPVALDATGSVFVYVQAGDESGLALQSWGESRMRRCGPRCEGRAGRCRWWSSACIVTCWSRRRRC